MRFLPSLILFTFLSLAALAVRSPEERAKKQKQHTAKTALRIVADNANKMYNNKVRLYEHSMHDWDAKIRQRKSETNQEKWVKLKEACDRHRNVACHAGKDFFKPARINRLLYATFKGIKPVQRWKEPPRGSSKYIHRPQWPPKPPKKPGGRERGRRKKVPQGRAEEPKYLKGWPEDEEQLHGPGTNGEFVPGGESAGAYGRWLLHPHNLRLLLPPPHLYGGPKLRPPPHVRAWKRYQLALAAMRPFKRGTDSPLADVRRPQGPPRKIAQG